MLIGSCTSILPEKCYHLKRYLENWLNTMVRGVKINFFVGFENIWRNYQLRQAKKGVQNTKTAIKGNVTWTWFPHNQSPMLLPPSPKSGTNRLMVETPPPPTQHLERNTCVSALHTPLIVGWCERFFLSFFCWKTVSSTPKTHVDNDDKTSFPPAT
jgi:hypothetical protein